MASRQSPSRQSSFSFTDSHSRRSSFALNPDIFSDDYALEPIDSRLDLSLEESTQLDHAPSNYDTTRESSNITPYPAIPPRMSMLNRPNSTSKRSSSNDEVPASREGTSISRTLSTSSRFSIVRSQSPYSGPTQPSHPYAMYPQVTRASSIASESTIRPHENPFVPTGGPEHPYSLYPQNTVPEEGDDIGEQPIPLGFPRLALNYQRSVGASGSDVGDIVGSDGHIESLPPYTRYADNVVAKGDMAEINGDSRTVSTRRSSERTTLVPTEAPTARTDVEEPTDQGMLLDETAKKETWQDKARRRVCGGIALWLLVAIIVLVVLAGVLGGVIGGVVGRKQGTVLAMEQGAATTTVWLDADPASTNHNTPACPTGRYVIPFNQTQEINSCVVDDQYKKAWGCLNVAFLGINVEQAQNPNGNSSLLVRFDDYSVNTEKFLYGPQPPDFNGSTFELKPYNDRDNQKLGVAMFFFQVFDKLSILPSYALSPPNNKRSVSARDIHERGSSSFGQTLAQGDEPWYCFFNHTLNEFWIFLDEPANASLTMGGPSTITPSPAMATQSSGYAESPTGTNPSMATVTPDNSMFAAGSTGWLNVDLPPSSSPSNSYQKRGSDYSAVPSSYTQPYHPTYPRLVKMIEKRLPENNIAPYCQKMKVLDSWQVVPSEDNIVIPIAESDYDSDTSTQHYTDMYRRMARKGKLSHRDTEQQLESNCICEWLSI